MVLDNSTIVINDLLEKMSLDEKIALVHGAGFFKTGSVERLGIPALVMSDGPNGVRQEFPDDSWVPVDDKGDFVSWLPSNTFLASTWNTDLAFVFGNVLGEEARGRGKDVILAPGINIKRTPLCGRNFEYMSEDPYLIGKLAAPIIQGVQQNDVAACVKHFALNNQEKNRMEMNVNVDEQTLFEIYLPAFYEALIVGGSLSVMASYNRYKGEHVCESKYLMQEILRDKWKYDGLAISDWGAVHDTINSAKYGVDLEMGVENNFDDYYFAKPLKEAVEKGEVDISVVDEKVKRILRTMIYTKVLEKDRKKGCFCNVEHQKQLEDISDEGIVLLKNDKKHLPMTMYSDNPFKKKRYLLIGDNANRDHALAGGSSEVKAFYNITPLQGLRMYLGGNAIVDWLPGYYVDNEDTITGEVDWEAPTLLTDYSKISKDRLNEIKNKQKTYFEDALKAAKEYDEVIFIGGNNHSLDVESADRVDLKLPYEQDRLIEALADEIDNFTVVIECGSAVEMPWVDKVHSLFQMSYPGMTGGYSLAKILFGEVNPSGKLPETYPLSLEDTPTSVFESYPGVPNEEGNLDCTYKEGMMVGYRYYTTNGKKTLFPFGYGLSYSKFAITNCSTVLRAMTSIHEFQVTFSCEMQNVSEIDGKEVVQLYLGVPREGYPKMVLKSFRKVFLKASEKKEINMILTQKDFETYDASKREFLVVPGEYSIYVGTSAEDIVYITSIAVNSIY